MKITGELVKSAIALKIQETFTTLDDKGAPQYPIIYKEQVVANMALPSFFVWQIEVLQEKQMNDTYRRTYMMEVRHHLEPHEPELYEKQADVGNTLMEGLRFIKLPDASGTSRPVRGTNMNFRIVDDVLVLVVNYIINVYPHTPEGVKMETLQQDQEPK